MTALTPKKIRSGYEPIKGYVLEELIGRGGFGEVWRAEAPGGLKKAVKFVYGDRDEHRAEQELKSLERIKGVQHPFILTLERFEIADDQLVIVTELADGSLDDLFKDRRKQGSCGIARQKLISYMRDTADALDYLHELYKLQHLDIKPANLLIVGGRIKVADFGLLKDLRDEVEHSVIGGLTPIYAPPELFDGRPSVHSDQYSLAVMYQELLTGTRPFSGRTIAQLATQHIHNAPNLKPLPPSDRPVVARALEKSPERRYRSCCDFVDQLSHQQDGSTRPTSVGTPAAVVENEREVQDLPELGSGTRKPTNSKTGHALVVALGGTGADCVSTLRTRIAELRSLSPLMLHSVVIDVDMRSSLNLKDGLQSDYLPWNKCIKTPLRSAMDYRNQGTEHLKSISRRWLYNVPKSGATEGMRPLGRLALVDHAKDVTDGLRDAIEQIREAAGETKPSVYVIGSLAGGSGSGMFVDIAYLLRFLLDEAGLHDIEILSLLSTARLQGDPSRPLVLHNTKAALQEVKHFLRPGNSYPGDIGANWNSVPAARTPLHNTYLIADSTTPRSSSPADTIVNYLWADATGAASLLDSARQVKHREQDTVAATPTLRSVGVLQLSGTRSLEENVLAPATTRHLLRRWLGDPSQSEKMASPLVQRLLRRCELSANQLSDRVLRGFAPDSSSIRGHLSRHLAGLPNDSLANAAEAQELFVDYFNARVSQSNLEIDADAIVANLNRDLTNRLVDSRMDFASAIKCANMLAAELKTVAETLRNDTVAVAIDADEYHRIVADPQRMLDFALLAIDCAAKRMAATHAQRISDRFTRAEQTLSIRAMTLAKAIRGVDGGSTGATNAWDEMNAPLKSQFETVIRELHDVCASKWLVKLVGDGASAVKPNQLVTEILEAAVPLVCRAVVTSNAEATSETGSSQSMHGLDTETSNSVSRTGSGVSVDGVESIGATAKLTDIQTDLASTNNDAPVLTIEEAVAAVRPALLSCGGYQRLILIVGSKAEQEVLEPQVQQYHKGSLTTVVIDSSPPMLIHEAERIVIDDVVARLTALSGGEDQISRRLMSRSDVDWILD